MNLKFIKKSIPVFSYTATPTCRRLHYVMFWVLALSFVKFCISLRSLGTRVLFYFAKNRENWEALAIWKLNFQISGVTTGFSRTIPFLTDNFHEQFHSIQTIFTNNSIPYRQFSRTIPFHTDNFHEQFHSIQTIFTNNPIPYRQFSWTIPFNTDNFHEQFHSIQTIFTNNPIPYRQFSRTIPFHTYNFHEQFHSIQKIFTKFCWKFSVTLGHEIYS